MDKILDAYESAKQNTIKGDFIDRLHSKYTVMLLTAIIILIGVKQYDGDAINCWLPTHFSDEQTRYTHQLCWVNNTYYYPDVTDADLFPESTKYILQYYQFILFILLGQILLFRFPTEVWKIFANDSIGYMNKVLDQVKKSTILSNLSENIPQKPKELKEKSENKESEPLLLTNEIAETFIKQFKPKYHTENEVKNVRLNEELKSYSSEEAPNLRRRVKNIFRSLSKEKKVLNFMNPTKGLKNLTGQYMFLKLANLTNVVSQFVFFHFMFGGNFFRYGVDFFVNLWNNKNPLALSTQFPIISFCDFYVHQNLRKIYWNAAQCLLAINVLIEKFYVIIWFWYVILIVVTVFNFFAWLLEFRYSQKISFLTKYINIRKKMMRNDRLAKSHGENYLDVDEENIHRFYMFYLGNDGILMLHLVKTVAGDMIFMDLLFELWIAHEKMIQNNLENFNE